MSTEDSLYARRYDDFWDSKQDIVTTHYCWRSWEIKCLKAGAEGSEKSH